MTKNVKSYWVVFLFCLGYVSSQGQQAKIDSLLNLLRKDKQDTIQIKNLNNLSWEYNIVGDYEKGLVYGNEALRLSNSVVFGNRKGWPSGIASADANLASLYQQQGHSDKALECDFAALKIRKDIGDQKGTATSCRHIGIVYTSLGMYDKAAEMVFSCLKIHQKIGNKKGIAESFTSMGNIYLKQGNYDRALEYYIQSLKINEELKDKRGLSSVLNNIGIVYDAKGNSGKALESYNAALGILKEMGNKNAMARAYTNIGILYRKQAKYKEALENFAGALHIVEEIGDKQGCADAQMNAGVIYFEQAKYEKALENDLAALKLYEEIGYKEGATECYCNIGDVYFKQNKMAEAKKQLLTGLEIGKQIGIKPSIASIYQSLSLVDSASGNWKEAYEYHKLFKLYTDSIFNAESAKSSGEMNARYENEKKESKILLLEKDKEKQSALSGAETKRHNSILIGVICVLTLVILFSVFMFNRWRITQRQKTIIEKQKKLVDEQKALVEEKNKDITDSINYAKRIQQAKLPKREDILLALPQSFVFFKPKDIVSGDFYFCHKTNADVFIAACDCTGHGVPGAFMSMIGSDKLEEAVLQSSDVSEILRRLNLGIKTALRQTDNKESTRDGMDIAFCAVDTEKGIVRYAGANRPIWIIRKGQKTIEETKATKKAIGGFTEDEQHFDSHELNLLPGDTFYIFTDGYADLFGGEDNKKITTRRFKEQLIGIQEKTMSEQETLLDEFAENWKGKTEQVDDILVIGIRL